MLALDARRRPAHRLADVEQPPDRVLRRAAQRGEAERASPRRRVRAGRGGIRDNERLERGDRAREVVDLDEDRVDVAGPQLERPRHRRAVVVRGLCAVEHARDLRQGAAVRPPVSSAQRAKTQNPATARTSAASCCGPVVSTARHSCAMRSCAAMSVARSSSPTAL